MGLCFGGGQIILGLTALVLGMAVLWGLKYLENAMRQDTRATVALAIRGDGPADQQLRERMQQCDCKIISWGIIYDQSKQQREITCIIEWHVRADQTNPPSFVTELAADARIVKLLWQPQGIQFPASAQPPAGSV
jgi:putative Mg2+ transporter-C (MgtC) family protein